MKDLCGKREAAEAGWCGTSLSFRRRAWFIDLPQAHRPKLWACHPIALFRARCCAHRFQLLDERLGNRAV